MNRLESTHQLEAIISNINSDVSTLQVSYDATSTYVFNNDRYLQLYGYTKQ